MSIQADQDWWKTMFDETYLITDARSVCDDEITRREVDVICEMLPVHPEHKILDLCGGHGRHSLELYFRGFTECTLLDYSRCLLDCALKKANELNASLDVVCCDSRNTGLPSAFFDHVCIMGNSMGYIDDSSSDRKMLEESHRLLRPGGWILVDVTNGKNILNSFSPSAWHEIEEDTVVCRQRERIGNRIHAREMVLSKKEGLIRDKTYSIRIFEPAYLLELLEQAGFGHVEVQTGFSPNQKEGDFGFMNSRMLARGQKP